MNENYFNFGDCSEFADTLMPYVIKQIPTAELGVIRGRVKMDEYEEYGDTEWEDCHAVVIIDDKHYLDAGGLIVFNKDDENYCFSNETLKIEMVALSHENYQLSDYSIYNEFNGKDGRNLLKKSIHSSFGKITEDGELDTKSINLNKEEAKSYIERNIDFFSEEINKAKLVLTDSINKTIEPKL